MLLMTADRCWWRIMASDSIRKMFPIDSWTWGPNRGPLDITFAIDVVRGVSGRVQIRTAPWGTVSSVVDVQVGHYMITCGNGHRCEWGREAAARTHAQRQWTTKLRNSCYRVCCGSRWCRGCGRARDGGLRNSRCAIARRLMTQRHWRWQYRHRWCRIRCGFRHDASITYTSIFASVYPSRSLFLSTTQLHWKIYRSKIRRNKNATLKIQIEFYEISKWNVILTYRCALKTI